MKSLETVKLRGIGFPVSSLSAGRDAADTRRRVASVARRPEDGEARHQERRRDGDHVTTCKQNSTPGQHLARRRTGEQEEVGNSIATLENSVPPILSQSLLAPPSSSQSLLPPPSSSQSLLAPPIPSQSFPCTSQPLPVSPSPILAPPYFSQSSPAPPSPFPPP
ncbi:mucin-7-like [Scylla paramamosain]|uniref:mucin-7-like n=1 Tax=Scylla paramamosain TaxID=85552 RepID=UPI0030831D60